MSACSGSRSDVHRVRLATFSGPTQQELEQLLGPAHTKTDEALDLLNQLKAGHTQHQLAQSLSASNSNVRVSQKRKKKSKKKKARVDIPGQSSRMSFPNGSPYLPGPVGSDHPCMSWNFCFPQVYAHLSIHLSPSSQPLSSSLSSSPSSPSAPRCHGRMPSRPKCSPFSPLWEVYGTRSHAACILFYLEALLDVVFECIEAGKETQDTVNKTEFYTRLQPYLIYLSSCETSGPSISRVSRTPSSSSSASSSHKSSISPPSLLRVDSSTKDFISTWIENSRQDSTSSQGSLMDELDPNHNRSHNHLDRKRRQTNHHQDYEESDSNDYFTDSDSDINSSEVAFDHILHDTEVSSSLPTSILTLAGRTVEPCSQQSFDGEKTTASSRLRSPNASKSRNMRVRLDQLCDTDVDKILDQKLQCYRRHDKQWYCMMAEPQRQSRETDTIDAVSIIEGKNKLDAEVQNQNHVAATETYQHIDSKSRPQTRPALDHKREIHFPGVILRCREEIKDARAAMQAMLEIATEPCSRRGNNTHDRVKAASIFSHAYIARGPFAEIKELHGDSLTLLQRGTLGSVTVQATNTCSSSSSSSSSTYSPSSSVSSLSHSSPSAQVIRRIQQFMSSASSMSAGCSYTAVVSEALSLEVMARLFKATLIHDEMEIEYASMTSSAKIDYTCSMMGHKVGVSVTRAFNRHMDGYLPVHEWEDNFQQCVRQMTQTQTQISGKTFDPQTNMQRLSSLHADQLINLRRKHLKQYLTSRKAMSRSRVHELLKKKVDKLLSSRANVQKGFEWDCNLLHVWAGDPRTAKRVVSEFESLQKQPNSNASQVVLVVSVAFFNISMSFSYLFGN